MSAASQHAYPRRALIGLAVFTLILIGLLGGGHQWSTAGLAPKLGLDLKGGTQMILEPVVASGASVNAEQLAQARDIIVQRVDAGGISGAEVTTQGDRNIVVSVPEVPSKETKEAIQQSSQLMFRPVLAIGAGTPAPVVTPTPTPTGSATGSATPSATTTASSTASATSNSAIPEAFAAASGTPTPTPSPSATSGSTTTPKDATDLAWITPDIEAAYTALDCSQTNALDNLVDDPAKPLVTCDADDAAKYILGPVVVSGDKITDAVSGYRTNSQGGLTSEVEIALTLNGEGTKQYAEISKKMLQLPEPQNQLAATLDSKVLLAPRFNDAILDGRASITGGFTLDGARALADQLKFGALPMSFVLQTDVDISPTLGADQLRFDLLAGLIGLVLVVLYSLFQYRLLGLVTIASLALAVLLTYLVVTILGWSHNYRLDMAGITGLIVAIGFTADSFIVYFERIRDELRDGRSLGSAVETGWARAKRTILAADGVNFLAALVLYLLASSNVRGFAFTLGLTTLLDLLIVFLFTHPLVALLARRPFFRDGHRWSGLDPDRLGATPRARYAGRGRFVPASTSSAGSQA